MYIYKKNLKWMILKEDKKTLVTKENYFNVAKNTFKMSQFLTGTLAKMSQNIFASEHL